MGDWYENIYPLPPNSSFSRKRESRGGVCAAPVTANTSTAQRPKFSYPGVPARAIGTKACPGLRSGMNGSRHRIRHSSDRKHAPYPDTGLESRRGGARPPYNRQQPGSTTIFITFCALRTVMVVPGESRRRTRDITHISPNCVVGEPGVKYRRKLAKGILCSQDYSPSLSSPQSRFRRWPDGLPDARCPKYRERCACLA